MALLKYFKVSKRSDNTYLPDVNGPLAKEMPSSAIAAANSSIARAMEIREQKQDTGKPRGEYRVYSGKEKAEIAKRAAVYGISATIRHYAKIDPKRVLPSSSVFDWKKQYQQEVQKRKREGEEDFEITALPCKKRGRTLLLGNVLDGRVQSFIRDMRCHGAVINTAVVMGCAEGIVSHHDSNLLAGNGGHITISKDWAKSLLHRMGYVKRRESTSAKVPPKDFDTLKAQFVYDADVLVDYGNIPDALVINWDHTGIKYIPVGSWTMEKEGQKRVQITGIDDKRQITAVFAATKTGSFLPIQVIYKGKTKRCLPSVDFPEDWLISFTENHWANETTTKDYIYKILLPYVEQKREELKLPGDHPALVVFDHFKGHLQWKSYLYFLLHKYVYLFMQCTKNNFL